jgi:hypothetical protein
MPIVSHTRASSARAIAATIKYFEGFLRVVPEVYQTKTAEARTLGGSSRSTKRILGQLELVRNQIATDCELRNHRYPKSTHDNVAKGETQSCLGGKGTRKSHGGILFANDIGTQQFFITVERRLVAIRYIQLLCSARTFTTAA